MAQVRQIARNGQAKLRYPDVYAQPLTSAPARRWEA